MITTGTGIGLSQQAGMIDMITAQQNRILRLRETDIDGALQRMNQDEKLYEYCLRAFLEDETVAQLNAALRVNSWDDAFTAAHALKGVAGNMGFVPLMHHTAQLIVSIRSGRTREIPQALEYVNSSYRDIVDAIHQYFAIAEEKSKETNHEN